MARLYLIELYYPGLFQRDKYRRYYLDIRAVPVFGDGSGKNFNGPPHNLGEPPFVTVGRDERNTSQRRKQRYEKTALFTCPLRIFGAGCSDGCSPGAGFIWSQQRRAEPGGHPASCGSGPAASILDQEAEPHGGSAEADSADSDPAPGADAADLSGQLALAKGPLRQDP